MNDREDMLESIIEFMVPNKTGNYAVANYSYSLNNALYDIVVKIKRSPNCKKSER
tara:strand:- start:1431 stop:1595 length:165 start_codon:yes stop_codon:yes gene_type:complete